MNSARVERQRTIVHMLQRSGPRSAQEIAAELDHAGFDITHATVARDLEQIGAVKMKRGGKLGYVLPERVGQRTQATERLRRIFAEWAQSVDTSGNLIVVRTPPGSAHLVALALDQAKFPEVLGTIAGDDAIFIAVRSDLPPEPLALRLRDLMRDH